MKTYLRIDSGVPDNCNMCGLMFRLNCSKSYRQGDSRPKDCPFVEMPSREDAIAILLKLQNGEGDANAWDTADKLGFKKEELT